MVQRPRLYSERVRQETHNRGQSLTSRFGVQYALDALAWVTALLLADVLRYDFRTGQNSWVTVLLLCLATVVVQLVVGWIFSLYRGRFVYGTFEEARALFYVVLITGVVCSIPVVLFGNMVHVPRGIVAIALPIAFVLTAGIRYLKRSYVERSLRPSEDAEPTLVYGAGQLGELLIRSMITDRHARYLPVAVVDDNPAKRNRWIRGVRVMGGGDDLAHIARNTSASVLIVAIARADATLLRRISDLASDVGLRVKVMPTLTEILEGASTAMDVRDIAIEDLIGRHPVDLDVNSIADYLTGKRVMITGAGGSIGSELCRQVSKFAPAELIMLDRDETGLQSVQLSIYDNGLLDSKEVVLADIRDAEALREIFVDRRPEVVFHAAALKHLPMLEQYPDEAWKTNVLGTLNVLLAAMEVGVGTFVNISTDKAANPSSVLGRSKRLTEKLTSWAAQQTGQPYLSVRFGNVIGSRGSVLPTFQALIAAGKPLTVTHPNVTRFFMTIPEACQLVVQAGGVGTAGEVLILDMGEPVRILDVAERLIAASGTNVGIIYTGLRDGEKLHEELTGHGELDRRPKHPKISHAIVPPLMPGAIDIRNWQDMANSARDQTAVLQRLRASG